jgi:uncharacterized membrane-anchored protein
MKPSHTPQVDARYWLAIALASIAGTNLGDLYAHESGLGIGWGLLVLVVIVVGAFCAERADRWTHEIYYWLVIIIIRTGATNIADFLAFRIRIPLVALVLGLAALLTVLSRVLRVQASRDEMGERGLPRTGTNYWFAMLSAGVFGTVLGDVVSHLIGQGYASLGLGALLALSLLLWRSRPRGTVAIYWLTVAVARTAGTAIGDWLAENKVLQLGLPMSTLITTTAFVAVLWLWPRRQPLAVPLNHQVVE